MTINKAMFTLFLSAAAVAVVTCSGTFDFPNAVLDINNRLRLSQAIRLPPLSTQNGTSPSSSPYYSPSSSSWDLLEQFPPWVQNRTDATQCGKDFFNFMVALGRKEQWAIAMLDAYGKLGSGITQGNLAWAGDYGLCLGITATPAVANTTFLKSFETEYCWLSFTLLPAAMNSSGAGALATQYPLRSAICVPDTCTEENLNEMMDTILVFVPPVKKFLNFTGVSCVPKDPSLWNDKGTVASFVICCVFIGLIVMGTIYDIFCKQSRGRSQFEYGPQINAAEHYNSDHGNSVNKTGEPSAAEVKAEDNNAEPSVLLPSNNAKQTDVPVRRNCQGIAEGMLVAFSLYTNGSKILNLSPGKDTITVLNGIRFFSMTWVILGHTFMLGCFNLDNPIVLLDVTKTFLFQIVAQGVLSVDTFFVLSGLLVTYLFLKEYDRSDGKISWLRFYFHRLWRLTPPYVLVLFLFYMRLSKYFSNGPFWPAAGFSGTCEKNWWWNVLYINNFNSINDMCMGWTWYLANDMQFFVLSPLILVPMAKRLNKLTAIVAVDFILISCICNGAISSYYGINVGLDLTQMAPGSEKYTIMFDKLYTKPWTRAGPYVVGMLCGWLLHKTKCQVQMKKHWVIVGWLLAVAVALSVVIGTYHAHPSQAVGSLYYSLDKVAWAVSVCWVIFACTNGYGGFVNSFLSWPAWNPLSRLTYMAYLWHYILLLAVFYSVELPMHFSYTFFLYYYLAMTLVTYLGALVLSLAFESPFLALEKVLFSR